MKQMHTSYYYHLLFFIVFILIIWTVAMQATETIKFDLIWFFDFSALLGVSHVMRSINVRYLLTLLTYLLQDW